MFQSLAIFTFLLSMLGSNIVQAQISNELEKKIKAKISIDNSENQGEIFYLKHSIVGYARVEVEKKRGETLFHLSCFSLGNGNMEYSEFEEVPSISKSDIESLHKRAIELRNKNKSSFNERVNTEIYERGFLIGPFTGLVEGLKGSPYMKDQIKFLKQLSQLMDKSLPKGTIVETKVSPCSEILNLQ